MSLRTSAGERFYGQMKLSGKLVPLADEPSITEWEHWRLIDNRFPYAVALRKHHLLLPKRVVADRLDLTEDERTELVWLLRQLSDDYDFVMENFPKRRSILSHYHLHLGEYYVHREDMKL
jgi:diadenosine tetraphosphate (Ap4A) HIT family hydrolase